MAKKLNRPELTQEELDKMQDEVAVIKQQVIDSKEGLKETVIQSEVDDKQKESALKDLDDDKKIEEAAIRKVTGNKGSGPKSQFMDAMTFFAPQIIGLVGGGLLGGTDAALLGEKHAAQNRDAFLNHQQGQEVMALQQQKELARQQQQEASLQQRQSQQVAVEAHRQKTLAFKAEKESRMAAEAKARLEASKSSREIARGNLAARQEQLGLERTRAKSLEQDRSIRRDERDLQRTINAKNTFVKGAEAKKFREGINTIDEIEDIVNNAPEIAIGTIPAKLARGIAGEVGVLTDQDIARANISPSFMRDMKRRGEKFWKGRLPEEDVIELRKVVAAMKDVKKQRFGNRIKGFAASRSKTIKDDQLKQDFLSDLMIESGLDAPKQKKPRLSPEQRSRLQELRNKFKGQ